MTEPSLTFVSELAGELGVTDPVGTYYHPLVGRWEDLDEEAQRLRGAAKTAGAVSADLADELGRLDASWSGDDADAFVTYLGEIRSASEGVEDALDELAGAVDELAGTLRTIVGDATRVLVDAADLLSDSAMLPVGGTGRARAQLRETSESVKSLHDAAEDVLREFARLCDGVDAPAGQASGIELRRHYPAEQFRLHGDDFRTAAEQTGPAAAGAPAADPRGEPNPAAPDLDSRGTSDPAAAQSAGFSGESAPAAAQDPDSPGRPDDSVAAAAADPHQGKESGVDPHLAQVDAGALPAQPAPVAPEPASSQGGGLAMMPMGGMGGGGGQRKPRNRTQAKPSELLGEPEPVVPPVIGEDPRPENRAKGPKPAQ